MSREYLSLPPTAMRRSDRAVEDEVWIRDLLARSAFGTLATVHDGQPFINTNLFVYDPDGHAVYLHTAQVGRTQANVEADDRICFSVSEMGRLLPADTALEFSVEYGSVIIFGRARILTDPDESRRALQLLLDKYFPHLKPGQHYRPITNDELARTAVYRIAIEGWTGKRKQAAPDFPGAFLYGHPPSESVS